MIGILGGMGPRATVLFQKILLDMSEGGDQSLPAMLCINDGNIPDRTAYLMSGGDDPIPAMAEKANILERAGATFLCVPCNTAQTPELHQRLTASVSVPVVHMPTQVVKELKRQKARKILLLATEGTVCSGMYQTLCKDAGIMCVVPDNRAQRIVSDLIKAVKQDDAAEMSRTARLLKRYIVSTGVDGAILGCTELPLVADKLCVPGVRLFDSLAILATTCLKQIKEEAK